MKTLIQESKDGKVSSTRVIALVLILLYLSYAVTSIITLDKLPDIPQNLSILIGALYGINKVGNALTSKQNNY